MKPLFLQALISLSAITILASCNTSAAPNKTAVKKDSITITTPLPPRPKIKDLGCFNEEDDSICKILLRRNKIGKPIRLKSNEYRFREFTYVGTIHSKIGKLKLISGINYKNGSPYCSGFDIYDDNHEYLGSYGFGYEVYEVKVIGDNLDIDIPGCNRFHSPVFKDSIPDSLAIGYNSVDTNNCGTIIHFCPSRHRMNIQH